ncbi:MAG TPA: DUF6599 family protein [Terriglobales bacterium]|jgi:hypothetical protein|nr:DUF6599 family protein [Terriglobales bacterium]
MRLSKLHFVLLLLLTTPLFADPHAPAAPILPLQFGGWHISGTTSHSTDPAVADPVNAAILKEYGFNDFESATYARDDGRRLSLRAARFADTSGAYGAFTFYKSPPMLVEKIGDQAGSLNERVLFYRGNILIDAVFQKLSAMSAAELRELAGELPLATGSTQGLPGLPAYLPSQAYMKNSAKYVLGPLALEKTNVPVPSQLVDFNAGAEVVVGKYVSSGGEAILLLISYPTPQIAGDHLRKIEAAQTQTAPSAIFSRRTGPIVVVVSGALSQSEAKALLASVNYEADVTWNENTYFDKRNNIGNLVWNALVLCGILMAFALVIGIAFGGLRVLVQRIIPERVFHREEQMDFISLQLAENPPKSRTES